MCIKNYDVNGKFELHELVILRLSQSMKNANYTLAFCNICVLLLNIFMGGHYKWGRKKCVIDNETFIRNKYTERTKLTNINNEVKVYQSCLILV